MDSSDILYIVIMAAVLVGGLFSKGKKAGRKSANAPTPVPDEHWPTGIPDEWQSDDEQTAPQMTAPQVAAPPVPPAPPATERMQRTVAAQVKAQPKRVPNPPRPADHPQERITLDTAEEARKAFIYSEIFQRKY